jgi:zinc protease
LQAHLVTTAERAMEAHAALREEIARLAEPEGIPGEELENAKNQLEIDQIYDTERPSQLVHTLGYWWAVAGLEYHTSYVQHLRAVTAADLRDFARRYLLEPPCVTGILVAPAERARLAELAREDAP